MNVSYQDAYAEACTALGDAIVQQRLLQRELERLAPQPTPETPVEAT